VLRDARAQEKEILRDVNNFEDKKSEYFLINRFHASSAQNVVASREKY
jgi:hypothetical protein